MLANIGSSNVGRNANPFLHNPGVQTYSLNNSTFGGISVQNKTTEGRGKESISKSPSVSTREERLMNKSRNNISLANPTYDLNKSVDVVQKKSGFIYPSENYGNNMINGGRKSNLIR